jgi:hypothetical protein
MSRVADKAVCKARGLSLYTYTASGKVASHGSAHCPQISALLSLSLLYTYRQPSEKDI